MAAPPRTGSSPLKILSLIFAPIFWFPGITSNNTHYGSNKAILSSTANFSVSMASIMHFLKNCMCRSRSGGRRLGGTPHYCLHTHIHTDYFIVRKLSLFFEIVIRMIHASYITITSCVHLHPDLK